MSDLKKLKQEAIDEAKIIIDRVYNSLTQDVSEKEKIIAENLFKTLDSMNPLLSCQAKVKAIVATLNEVDELLDEVIKEG